MMRHTECVLPTLVVFAALAAVGPASAGCSSSSESDGSTGTTVTTSTGSTQPSGGAGGSEGGSGPAGGAGGDAPVEEACTPEWPSPEVDAAAFGAVGDGVTDDTAALQAGFAEIEASGGVLVLGAGRTYLISDKLQVQDATGFGIRGNGATLRVAAGTPTSDHVPLTFRGCSSFVVADLTIDGNRSERTPAEVFGGHNIRILAASDFLFSGVTSSHATTDGFYVAPTDNSDPTTFPSDGAFCDCAADDDFRQGMSIINGRRLQVIRSSFTHTNGTAPEAGIDIEPNPGSASPGAEQIVIRGCLFEDNLGPGVATAGPIPTDHLLIEDSVFRRNDGYGLMLNIGSHVTVDGCIFDDNVHGAIRISTRSTLVQNSEVMNHTGWVGMHLVGPDASEIVVRDNDLHDNTGIPTSGDAWIYVNEDSGTDNYLLENVFQDNEDSDIANQKPSGTCAAGNLMDGTLDAPADSCGVPPVVGFGT
ncbi:MAG: right-handed parallel beta-helix repeat-containing protein [Deltaproteobacteria bacterium]|jgi:hypothetical protein|nr:right-handed parallel beta-helix repeat-containing protein [Deltaproteobacteria bacterium]MBW2530407.1 right-handed parallel beta-helix repeat-containing protein [Deltaproteobacteria bacterium]